MIQIFLKFIHYSIAKTSNEIHPNFKSIVSGSVVMVKFFPFYLCVFSKGSVIIIGDIHSKYPGNIFLKHWLVSAWKRSAICRPWSIWMKSLGAGQEPRPGLPLEALPVITMLPSPSYPIGLGLRVALTFSHGGPLDWTLSGNFTEWPWDPS